MSLFALAGGLLAPLVAAEAGDYVPETDAVSPAWPGDRHTRRGHDLVGTEEYLDAVVVKMRVETVPDETGWHRIYNPLDADAGAIQLLTNQLKG